ncbi:MAG: hypothetical protein Q9214_007363 [Letrouitia sp. 1 TL-2023]
MVLQLLVLIPHQYSALDPVLFHRQIISNPVIPVTATQSHNAQPTPKAFAKLDSSIPPVELSFEEVRNPVGPESLAFETVKVGKLLSESPPLPAVGSLFGRLRGLVGPESPVFEDEVGELVSSFPVAVAKKVLASGAVFAWVGKSMPRDKDKNERSASILSVAVTVRVVVSVTYVLVANVLVVRTKKVVVRKMV